MPNMKLLLVDDEPELLEILEIVIESNFDVVTETSLDGLVAIEKIKANSYDAIYCDFTIPGANGLEVFQVNKVNNNHPFVIMSGKNIRDTDYYDEFTNTNILNHLLEKPFFEDDIVNSINKISKNTSVINKESNVNYFRINIKSFRTKGRFGYDLFLKINEDKFLKIYNKNDESLEETVANYIKKDVCYFYLNSEDYKYFINSKINNLKKIISSSNKKNQQFENFMKVNRFIQDELCSIGFDQELLNEADTLIKSCVEELSEVEEFKSLIEHFLSKEGHLSAHTSLLVYLIKSISYQSNILDLTKEKTFCLAAILHDITLEDDELASISSTYDSRFIQLNNTKRMSLMKHPIEAEALSEKLSTSDPLLKGLIVNHHEKPNGKGFPKGVDAEKLDQEICFFILAHEVSSFLLEGSITSKRLSLIINKLKLEYGTGNFIKPLSYFEAYLKTLI